jgi:hypothetical protein
MNSDLVTRAATLILVGGILSACSGMGTVVAEDDPDTEVPNLSMGRSIMEGLGAVPARRTAINYSPRAPLVIPANTAALATPEDPAAVAGNWPVDPEVESARLLREAEKKNATRDKRDPIPSSELMGLRTPPPAQVAPAQRDGPLMPSELRGGPTSLASNGPLYDSAGQPVRRALVEPPVAYLEPAPGVPVAIPEDPPKKRTGLFAWLPW